MLYIFWHFYPVVTRVAASHLSSLSHSLSQRRCNYQQWSNLMIAGKYFGPIVGGVREGKGILDWSNGDTYEGNLLLWFGKMRLGCVVNPLRYDAMSYCAVLVATLPSREINPTWRDGTRHDSCVTHSISWSSMSRVLSVRSVLKWMTYSTSIEQSKASYPILSSTLSSIAYSD